VEETVMEKATINGVELDYEVTGSGDPVLLIGTGPIADSFSPLVREEALSGNYRLIRYHQRGQAGGAPPAAPISFAEHATDAAALLGHLGIHRAHAAGHSTGAAIALQLAVDRPDVVHTVALLEPPLLGVPSAGAFVEKVGAALAAYGLGDREGAMAGFLSFVSGLNWDTCRTAIDNHVPGGAAQAMKDADTFFGSYLPALQAWQFGPEQAASISCPMLSILGMESERLFLESNDLLHSWFLQLEDFRIQGVGHLLHMQRPEPVAQGVTAFFARHSIAGTGPAAQGAVLQLGGLVSPEQRT
jgi:pimeloyl-ACP methyl ester carboxylesterase